MPKADEVSSFSKQNTEITVITVNTATLLVFQFILPSIKIKTYTCFSLLPLHFNFLFIFFSPKLNSALVYLALFPSLSIFSPVFVLFG